MAPLLHTRWLCCTAQFASVLVLAGCGTLDLFGRYELPESADVEAKPWPRLVDTPQAPAQGEFTAAVPDPAEGERRRQDLAAAAIAADVRANSIAGPVISQAEKDRWARRTEAKKARAE